MPKVTCSLTKMRKAAWRKKLLSSVRILYNNSTLDDSASMKIEF